MAEERGWTGRLVVRFLGKDIEQDYDQKRKPNAQVDPSLLKVGCGALHFRPVQSVKQHVPIGGAYDYGNEDKSSNVRLDVFLFPPPDLSTEPLSINLTRQYGEDASNCLNRLCLNLSRKIQSTKRGDKGKKNKKHVPVDQCVSIFDGTSQPLDISGKSNAEFWGMGMEKPLTIRISLDGTVIQLDVEVNPPTILSVSTFEKFGAEIFPDVPILLQVTTLFSSQSIVDWYADGRIVCENSLLYVPTTEDANKRLEVMITPVKPGHNGDGCQEAYRFQERVAASRPENTTLNVRSSWQETRAQGTLRVMSYNILADQNAFSGADRTPYFPWVSADVLKRSRRMPLILHEVLAYQADVICLQEVDQIVFDTLLAPVLRHYSYQGFYSVKQTSGNQEGCAMFWSLNKFQAANDDEYHTYGLSRLLERYEEPLDEGSDWKPCAKVITEIFRKRPDLLDTIKTKLGHVAQIAHLRSVDGLPLLVSNTHLFFHPDAPHVRLMQLFAIAHQLTVEQGLESTPFILCGDLNTSLKNCAVLLMERHVPKNHRDYRECFNAYAWNADRGRKQNNQFDYDFPEMRLPDSFPDLETAYPDYPDFTHYIVGFNATLDHILMTPKMPAGDLRFIRQGEMPTLDQVTKDQALPSPSFPSDHIAVIADLEWKPTK